MLFPQDTLSRQSLLDLLNADWVRRLDDFVISALHAVHLNTEFSEKTVAAFKAQLQRELLSVLWFLKRVYLTHEERLLAFVHLQQSCEIINSYLHFPASVENIGPKPVLK